MILHLGMQDEVFLQKATRIQLDFLLVLIDGENTQISIKHGSNIQRNWMQILFSTKANTPDKSTVYSWFIYISHTKTPNKNMQSCSLILSEAQDNLEQATESQENFLGFLACQHLSNSKH